MEHYMGVQKKIQLEEKKFQLKFTFPKSNSYCEFKTGFRSSVVYVVFRNACTPPKNPQSDDF